MDGRCLGCHHWSRNASPFDTGWGECARISQDPTIGSAGAAPSDLASANGREPGEGFLTTRAAFGCVEFAPLGHPAAWVGEGSQP